MKWEKTFAIIIVVVVYFCIGYTLSNVGEKYQKSHQTLQEGLESINALTATDVLPSKKQLYVVYFTADWCTPCNQMKPHWRHKTVVDQLKKYKDTKRGTTYKPYKVDIDLEKNKSILKKYKVTGIPCIILMTNDGKEWGRSSGYQNQTQLRTFLSKGAQWKRK